MFDLYIKDIHIDKVRNLENIDIKVSDKEKKHILITGKNGSGKTSLLDAMAGHIEYLAMHDGYAEIKTSISIAQSVYENAQINNESLSTVEKSRERLEKLDEELEQAKQGLLINFSKPFDDINVYFKDNEFIIAYYRANRVFSSIVPKNVEKVKLKNYYSVDDKPRKDFIKYLLDMKMTEALARNSGKQERAESIHRWFEKFDDFLKEVFEDKSTKLLFDEETFLFSIHQDGKEDFSFNTLSDGFAAVLDIAVDMMIRMEKYTGGTFKYDMPGIVLIDEIETHLHLELQKTVMKLLTTMFPNVQFVVSTHSPFILSSVENAVIYDLENKTLVENGLSNATYSGIVEGYFKADELSKNLRDKYEEYKNLVTKEHLSDADFERISKLEFYLDEIPDYLALSFTTEYQKLKNEFEARNDL
ncbi:Predicted ATP-binding protein involved in virulence [Butyrivibrio sp. INlla18]|uniref:AAA family ATPase n=1 Tax=Butyrivibrio sp. INlla18 TaxID=1520806 RepID=UPI00088C4A56|nr:AAA family ATPase [Butyrivibrio sp. INlla18]SDA69843.1 Predicted ATP-binding protein involved in virulence [Butyrivibrio sp. INlla18]